MSQPDMHDEKVEFTDFAREMEPRLRYALVARLPAEEARDATQEALIYAWEHWERVRAMDNPAGFLYTVAKRRGWRSRARQPVPMLHEVPQRDPDPGEPGLVAALRGLSVMQRRAVYLVDGLGLSQQEAADLIGVARTTVQRHRDRALRRLRSRLGVSPDE